MDLSFLFCPFLSFLGLPRFFRDFPDLLGDGQGFSPFIPFLFPKHLLGQKFSLQGKIGRIFPQREDFPSEG